MFRRILVANRGEIAARILKTCRALGIETVAVYSEADADSPHLEAADQRVCIGPPHASRSYLDADRLLAAAHAHECQAIHPGYGFLSENALFATRCRQERITFIGPRPESIRLMGDKVSARRAAASVGLPMIPGSAGALASAEEAAALAARIGFPVLLKAVAGGGGRGMRVVRAAAELADLHATATAEARAAFGDGSLYLERYVENGRHIEVQVLGDAFGHVIHLGTRECSVQRNHQKLLEEAPAPGLSTARAAELGARVVAAISRLGYLGAGTVELLHDTAHDELYFLEMNTRLQVEHPVTEMITGVDLVAWQLRIAANERLTLKQEDLRFTGHAIECRINAEDARAGFRPAAGTIDRLVWPSTEAGVRIDTHVRAGYTVPPFYDSLIAKLIVAGRDRPDAIARCRNALAATRIEGVPTTLELHARLLESPEFVSGAYSTATLPGLLSRGLLGPA